MQLSELREAFVRSRYGTAAERFGLCTVRGPAPSWAVAGLRWAVVTAWNPGGRPQSQELNSAAQDRLSVRTAHLDRLKAVNGDGTWQEEAWLLLHLSLRETVQLGRESGQAAVLFGVGSRVALVWCAAGTARPERFWATVDREPRGSGQG